MEGSKRDCCICGSTDSLFQVQEKWICEKCLDIGNQQRFSRWKDSIKKLFKEYSEACYQCLSSDDPEDIHKVRVLGRRIRSILQFIGIPKQHALLLSIVKVHLILNKIREMDVFMAEIKQEKEENKVHLDMILLLSEKQKEIKEQFNKILPILINDSFHHKVEIFANYELIPYIVQLEKEKRLRKHVEQFNNCVEEYQQTAKEKSKTSGKMIKLLHNVRKKAKSLRYVYHYFDEVFGEKYSDREVYYKSLQHQFGEIIDLEDWLKMMKAFEKMIDAPKRDVKEVKDNLKRRLKHLMENVELDLVNVNEV